MSSPISPVTKSSASTLIEKFLVKDLVKLYKDEFDVDVTRFFKASQYVELYECEETKYRFYYPYTTAGNAEFYETLQKNHVKLNLTYYRGWAYDHQFAFDNISSGDKVLDIGCGSGNFLEKAREKTLEVHGLEFNDMAIKACIEKNISVKKESIEDHALHNIVKYDVVCAFQVLEHISDIKTFLDNSIEVLRPGGKLIIGVPNNEPFLGYYNKFDALNLPPHHMGLWNKKSFLKLQNHFPLTFMKVDYGQSTPLIYDTYYYAKYLLNIKSGVHKHSFMEKIKLIIVAPFALLSTIFKTIKSGKSKAFMVICYQKNG